MTETTKVPPMLTDREEAAFALRMAGRHTDLLKHLVCECPYLLIPIKQPCEQMPPQTYCPSFDCWRVGEVIAHFDFECETVDNWLALARSFNDEERAYYHRAIDSYMAS